MAWPRPPPHRPDSPRHDQRAAEHPDDPGRPRCSGGTAVASLLAAGGARRGTRRDAPAQGADRDGPGAGAVPRRPGAPGAARPRLSAPRRRPGLRQAGARRAALPVPRLAVRRAGAMPADPRRAAGQPPLLARAPGRVPGGREERGGVRLPGAGRGARVPGLRLLCRARQPYLRVQGVVGVQLAAGAGSRHRSGARVVPASLLHRRGHGRQLRQAVPRRLGRLATSDHQGAAGVRLPGHPGRGRALRPAPDRAAPAVGAADPCAGHQPGVPAGLRDPDERGDDHLAVARPDRRYPLLLVRHFHQLHVAGRQAADARAARADDHPAQLCIAQEPAQRLRLRRRGAAQPDLHRDGHGHQRARPVGLRVDGADPGPHARASGQHRQGHPCLPAHAGGGDRGGRRRRRRAQAAARRTAQGLQRAGLDRRRGRGRRGGGLRGAGRWPAAAAAPHSSKAP